MIKVLNGDAPALRRKHIIYYNGESSYQEIRWHNHVEFSDGTTMFHTHYYSCSFEEKKFSKPKIVWTWFSQMVLGTK